MTMVETALQQIPLGPSAVGSWLDANPEASTPEFIAELSSYALSALQQGALSAALAAYILTGIIQMRRGDREGALRSKIHEIEVLFMAAQTTDAYEEAYALAKNSAGLARESEYPDLAFWAAGLAADSAYWGADAAADTVTRKKWLRAAVDTLARIEPPSPGSKLPGPWGRFVSSLVATYQTVTGKAWGPEQDAVDAALQRLAAVAERLIPLDFAFDDPTKTAHVAHHLAGLSTQFGSREAAEARLRAVQQGVKSDTWSD